MQKKNYRRLINNRPACFCAFALLCGILIGEPMSFINPYFKFIPIIVLIAGFICLLFFKKTRKFAYLAIAVLSGFISISAANEIKTVQTVSETVCVIDARVASEIVVFDDERGVYTQFYVDKIVIDGRSVKGKSKVTFDGALVPDFGAGDIVRLRGYADANELKMFDSLSAYYASKNINYNIYTFTAEKLFEAKPKFPLNIQIKIKQALYDNLDYQSASMCQALLLGDKFGIDEDLYINVKASGIAHVFAVSGLHIAAVAGMLFFVLKKLKVNAKINFAIVMSVTFLYVMICAFSPSAIRAFIMAFVFAAGGLLKKKRDNLSSLGVAASLIMLFNPFSFVDVGFLLSIFAVLGITIFYSPLKNTGRKLVNKISPKKNIGARMTDACSLTLSANIFTFPLVSYFFNTFATLFLITNVILVPYVMFIYTILLIIAVIVLITGMGGLFIPFGYLLMPFKAIVSFIANLSFAQIGVSSEITFILGWTLVMLLLTRFVFLTRYQRMKAVFATTAVTAELIFLFSVF